MKKHIIIACQYAIVTGLLLGVAYPLLVTGIARLAFPDKSNGQLIQNGQLIGSHVIGRPGHFALTLWRVHFRRRRTGGTKIAAQATERSGNARLNLIGLL